MSIADKGTVGLIPVSRVSRTTMILQLILTTKKTITNEMKEVLRRLEENDLYINPEKCVWKVTKVPFLGVVMSCQLTLETGIKPTVPLSAIDKENSLRVLAILCLTYIQECLFTIIWPCV